MASKLITGTANPFVKRVSLLQAKKSARKKERVFVLEGLRAVNEIPEQVQVHELITTQEVDATRIKVPHEQMVVVTEEVYKVMSDTQTPQGVMATVGMCDIALDTLEVKADGFYLILENIQDPGNLGTIIRTAHGFGVDAIFLTKGCVDVYNPKTIRSSMASLLHVPIILDLDIETVITWMQTHKVALYATDLQESKPLAAYDFRGKLAVAIGNEANGITETLRSAADYKMRIPMPGGLESLNASIAASVCMYEVMRQREKGVDKVN